MTGGQRLAIALVAAGYLALALSLAWPIISRRYTERRVIHELREREKVRRELEHYGTGPRWHR